MNGTGINESDEISQPMHEGDFEMAKAIADAASFFDGIKPSHVCTEREQAIEHIEALHNIAEVLAADRLNEIYAPEEAPVAPLGAIYP